MNNKKIVLIIVALTAGVVVYTMAHNAGYVKAYDDVTDCIYRDGAPQLIDDSVVCVYE